MKSGNTESEMHLDFENTPEEAMKAFKENISTKTMEELETMKCELSTAVEKAKEQFMVLMENDLKKTESGFLKRANSILTTVLFVFSLTVALSVATILSVFPFIKFLPMFFSTGIIGNIFLRQLVNINNADQIFAKHCARFVNARKIEAQVYIDSFLEILQFSINEMIQEIDEEIKNRQENSVTPINKPTKTFDNKINVEETRENPTHAYTKRKF